MKRRLMIIGIILILLTVGFSGCNENNDKKENENPPMGNTLIGSWETYPYYYENGVRVDDTQSTAIIYENDTNENCGCGLAEHGKYRFGLMDESEKPAACKSVKVTSVKLRSATSMATYELLSKARTSTVSLARVNFSELSSRL